MSHDFKKKEPSKTEKVLYELFMQQQGMERALATNSALMVSMAMLMKIEPEKLAQMLADNAPIKEYSDKINKAIDKLEEGRKAKEMPAEEPSQADEHAGHDHAV